MDAAQKLALLAAHEAFKSYGYPARRLPDRHATVIIASSLSLGTERDANTAHCRDEFDEILSADPHFAGFDESVQRRVKAHLQRTMYDKMLPLSPFSIDGYIASGISAVISNEFSLHAVPVVIDAACASSFAALDAGVRGLLEGRYDFVVTGGVDLPANARDLVICANLRLLSVHKIAPFDERADGFSVGEGCGIFLLKRFSDAKAAGDPIYAVIRAIGASSDAKSLIAPDVGGQELAIRRAFERVDFAPSAIQYIEAHGTGTAVGDQVEARAISAVYKDPSRSAPLALGSVKSMIGHTFSAAGAAGLLKTILALNHKTIPPNANLARLNPHLGLDEIPGYVCTEAQPWSAPGNGPRRAAVSAMGTGGINFHVLVEEMAEGETHT